MGLGLEAGQKLLGSLVKLALEFRVALFLVQMVELGDFLEFSGQLAFLLQPEVFPGLVLVFPEVLACRFLGLSFQVPLFPGDSEFLSQFSQDELEMGVLGLVHDVHLRFILGARRSLWWRTACSVGAFIRAGGSLRGGPRLSTKVIDCWYFTIWCRWKLKGLRSQQSFVRWGLNVWVTSCNSSCTLVWPCWFGFPCRICGRIFLRGRSS